LGEFFGPCELLVKFGRGAGFACHRQREAVTVFGNSLDGIPAQRFSQATYDIREVGFAYECAGPQRVRQFFLRDKTLGFREQAEQSKASKLLGWMETARLCISEGAETGEAQNRRSDKRWFRGFDFPLNFRAPRLGFSAVPLPDLFP
jgi:hypothetical protein